MHTPPEAPTDEHAFPSTSRPAAAPPLSLPEPLVSASLNRTFPEPASSQAEGGERLARRHRHDGWTPDRQILFLEALAACGVVTDACRHVGLSAQSAYAFRNRRSGRAFATAWDAVLVHRARGRLSDELFSRAMNGCIEAIRQNDEVTAERHRFDNRLSMAVLTRLDRLAEKEGHREEQLRAVSEALDDFLDCVEQGGDADAFIEARRPKPVEKSRGLIDSGPIWSDNDGRLWTDFPPPDGFEGEEQGVYDGLGYYARTLTPSEEAVIEADRAARRDEEARERDAYFGFSSGEAGSLPSFDGERPPAPAGCGTTAHRTDPGAADAAFGSHQLHQHVETRTAPAVEAPPYPSDRQRE